VVIGKVIDEDRVRIHHNGMLKVDVPAETLVLGGGAPVYVRESREPAYLAAVRSFDPKTLPLPKDYNKVLLGLLGSPSIASKRWVYDQYDSMVRTNTIPSSFDAAVVRIKGTEKSLVLKTDCNGRYVYLNPKRGGQIAVAECARNVACTGATPVAITNCLNFGNPYDPEVYWQFTQAVSGVREACIALNTPVTGGNVSFYNESPDDSVLPTPVIGMLGLLDNSEMGVQSGFRNAGDIILLLGKELGEIGGSEYLFQQTHKVLGDAPLIDLIAEKSLQALCIQFAKKSLIQSAHDCAEGGIAVAITEALFGSDDQFGATISLTKTDIRLDFQLFGETQSRIIISVKPEYLENVMGLAARFGVPIAVIGSVNRSGELRIGNEIRISLKLAEEVYQSAIPRAMGER
jgi:phosphoribosylformylglycinamidine synthase